MLMILARLVRSESFWAVAKVRSPHTGPGIRYIIENRHGESRPPRRGRPLEGPPGAGAPGRPEGRGTYRFVSRSAMESTRVAKSAYWNSFSAR